MVNLQTPHGKSHCANSEIWDWWPKSPATSGDLAGWNVRLASRASSGRTAFPSVDSRANHHTELVEKTRIHRLRGELPVIFGSQGAADTLRFIDFQVTDFMSSITSTRSVLLDTSHQCPLPSSYRRRAVRDFG